MTEVAYGKTPLGQLLYDLAFTDLKNKYLARKHRLPIQTIRDMRAGVHLRELRKKTRRQRR